MGFSSLSNAISESVQAPEEGITGRLRCEENCDLNDVLTKMHQAINKLDFVVNEENIFELYDSNGTLINYMSYGQFIKGLPKIQYTSKKKLNLDTEIRPFDGALDCRYDRDNPCEEWDYLTMKMSEELTLTPTVMPITQQYIDSTNDVLGFVSGAASHHIVGRIARAARMASSAFGMYKSAVEATVGAAVGQAVSKTATLGVLKGGDFLIIIGNESGVYRPSVRRFVKITSGFWDAMNKTSRNTKVLEAVGFYGRSGGGGTGGSNTQAPNPENTTGITCVTGYTDATGIQVPQPICWPT
ncbi:hypothetical protein HG263_01925 [Pseudoalteromonas sp. JBTF-M23]|uniref:Uncharacterized protein n=1 Tax=Pseudoalteromonas caenipelagi TaxID=2726988 RepID=A0A849V963_9GAMM|nr:hypothetical protein [Pseudoalteromonas caenipelagi]NOU49310.1 hypothetical protein [Pseudoalteromonas caenipelagi]